MKHLNSFIACLWIVMIVFLTNSCGRDDTKPEQPASTKAPEEASHASDKTPVAETTPTAQPQPEAKPDVVVAIASPTPVPVKEETPLMTWTSPQGTVWGKYQNALTVCVRPTTQLLRNAFAADFHGFGNSVMWVNNGDGTADYKYNSVMQTGVGVNTVAINVCIK